MNIADRLGRRLPGRRLGASLLLLVVAVVAGVVLLNGARDGNSAEDRNMRPAEQTNHLANATSPYLLQHADNPVDWYEWSAEALERAKKEDKPIFLSIGYSACHWCHVMEHESFENEEIAQVLNEHFVSIKVDREQRPDLDEIYMNAVQMMTGSGGWPMTVFLTPDLEPFFAGTYFPPEDKWGRPGFRRVLTTVAEAYRDQRDQVAETAAEVTAALRRIGAGPAGGEGVLDRDLIEAAVRELSTMFDDEWGGFGGAPKFPQSSVLRLLLRARHRTGNEQALRMATLTLDKMARGGMHDHLGGGFHRYSVDREWLVPHFEKMLYDNAQLAVAYLEAYQVTQKPSYERIVRETLDYVLGDLVDEAGGFHSTRDADSEGEEGKFYVWSKAEIADLLGGDAEFFCGVYGVSTKGNFEGHNILNLKEPLERVAEREGVELPALLARLEPMRQRLAAARAERVPPGKDDKVLTDWNGLMISAFARAHQVLDVPEYRAAGERAAQFALTTMRPEGRLKHVYRAGRAEIDAYLDDYAFLLQALIDLHETTFDLTWVEHAEGIAQEMIERLWDAEAGGFYFAPPDQADLIAPSKNAHDGALPSGNAIAIDALLRLAKLTDDADHLGKAEQSLGLFTQSAQGSPQGYASLLGALDLYLGPVKEIAIAGRRGDSTTDEMLSVVRQSYMPNKVVALVDPEEDNGAAAGILPLLQAKSMIGSKATAYVCENYQCDAPVSSPAELRELLTD